MLSKLSNLNFGMIFYCTFLILRKIKVIFVAKNKFSDEESNIFSNNFFLNGNFLNKNFSKIIKIINFFLLIGSFIIVHLKMKY